MPLIYAKHFFILIIASSVTHFVIQKLFDSCSSTDTTLVNEISEKVETNVIKKIQKLAQKDNQLDIRGHLLPNASADHIKRDYRKIRKMIKIIF